MPTKGKKPYALCQGDTKLNEAPPYSQPCRRKMVIRNRNPFMLAQGEGTHCKALMSKLTDIRTKLEAENGNFLFLALRSLEVFFISPMDFLISASLTHNPLSLSAHGQA